MFEAGPNAKSIKAHCCTCHGIRAQLVRLCWARSLPPAPYQTLTMLWALQPQHKGRSDVLLILSSDEIKIALEFRCFTSKSQYYSSSFPSEN